MESVESIQVQNQTSFDKCLFANFYEINKIMPINYTLMDESALKKDDVWINDMIDKWGRVHFVRTVLGGIAFALNIKAILM